MLTSVAMVSTLLKSSVGRLRLIAFIEGVSFLILLFVAMPMKYLMDMPGGVRVVGMAHGLLFLLFACALTEASVSQGWRPKRWGPAFLSSLVPFGTFVADGHIKRWEEKIK